MDILKSAWGDLLNENEKLAALLDEKDARIERLRAVKTKMICEGCRRLAEVADENERLLARIERLEAIIQFSADQVSKIAFDIPPPNEQTPLLVMLANGMRAALAGKEGT